jgi:hypothetical protein
LMTDICVVVSCAWEICGMSFSSQRIWENAQGRCVTLYREANIVIEGTQSELLSHVQMSFRFGTRRLERSHFVVTLLATSLPVEAVRHVARRRGKLRLYE